MSEQEIENCIARIALSDRRSFNRSYKLWLVEPEKDTVSLGVIEAGKTAIELNRDQVNALEAGGLLAVDLEQRGGSPKGMAQGPILAVGEPKRF